MPNPISLARRSLHLTPMKPGQPDPPYTVSQWANKNCYLSSVASAEPGLWRTARTPYLREIMDNLFIFVGVFLYHTGHSKVVDRLFHGWKASFSPLMHSSLKAVVRALQKQWRQLLLI
ncbi:MAG: large subunit GpA [Candidatus Tokpelaia sp. JSC189]|nr:MAG: large subunit GpA [Candidatus Tokpelaia sp. JSC189]